MIEDEINKTLENEDVVIPEDKTLEDETLENEDVEPKEETTPKKGKKNKKPKEEVKQEETLEEVQVVNEDGFIAGQEIDSKTYFEFIAKQRNS